MTKLSLAIISVSLLIASTSSASAQDVIELPLNLQSGDLLLIQYTHERNDNGQVNGTTIEGEILIGDTGLDTIGATWTTISMEVGGVVIDASHPEAPGLMVGIPIRYVALVDGTPIRIEDREELLEIMMASIIANRGGESVDREALARTRELFESMNDDALASAFLTVPKYLAICQGTALELGQPTMAEVEGPSPVGTATVSSMVTYVLDGIDEEKGLAQIEYRSTLDPVSAEQMLRALMAQLAGPDGIPESELEGMSIERNDSASCEVNTESGLAESVTYSSELKVLDQSRTETLVFSVLHRPAGSR